MDRHLQSCSISSQPNRQFFQWFLLNKLIQEFVNEVSQKAILNTSSKQELTPPLSKDFFYFRRSFHSKFLKGSGSGFNLLIRFVHIGHKATLVKIRTWHVTKIVTRDAWRVTTFQQRCYLLLFPGLSSIKFEKPDQWKALDSKLEILFPEFFL